MIAFVSYYGGGYVAARMSRFDGARQGFAVWLWAVVVAIVVAIVAAVAGAKFDVLSTLNTFPRLPVDQGNLTGTGIVALLLLLADHVARRRDRRRRRDALPPQARDDRSRVPPVANAVREGMRGLTSAHTVSGPAPRAGAARR